MLGPGVRRGPITIWAFSASLWAVAAGPARGQETVRVETAERYYELDAATLGGAIERLNGARLEGPDGPPSQGLTRYEIEPAWRAVASDGSCRVGDLRIDVRIMITLPRWPAVDRRPPEEQERWAMIEGAIRSHEYVHRDLTIEAAEQLEGSLRGAEALGCATLNDVVAGRVSIARDRLSEAHGEFDRSTPKRLPIG